MSEVKVDLSDCVEVVGVSSYEKDKQVSYNLYYTCPFEPYEQENGAIGMKVGQEWTREVDCSLLFPGDIVRLSYRKGFKGMATLSNIQIVQKSSQRK